jgi:hypothetical protein
VRCVCAVPVNDGGHLNTMVVIAVESPPIRK